MGLGLVLGAISGGAEASLKEDEREHQARLQRQNAEHSADVQLERQKTLELFKAKQAEQSRADRVTRVDARVGEIAEAEVSGKRGIVQAGIADPAAWTAEQQGAVDQSLALDRKGLMDDPETRLKASVQTGDTDPKDYAAHRSAERRTDVSEKRVDASDRATEARERSATLAAASREYTAQLREETAQMREENRAKRLESVVKGSGGTREALAFLEGQRKELASDAQNLRQLYQAEIKGMLGERKAAIDAAYAPKFAEIERKRTLVEQDYNSMRERVGLPARTDSAAPAPTPKPAAAPPKPGASGPKPTASTAMKPWERYATPKPN